MKTAEDWLASMPVCFDHCVTKTVIDLTQDEMRKKIAEIQRDAFLTGRREGIEQAAEMCYGDSHIEEGVLSLLK